MFCYQARITESTRPVDAGQFWALVRAPRTRELIECFRQTGEQSLKRKLPAFIFQATFDETPSKKNNVMGRWRKQAATRLTGLVVMDVDHVDNPREVFLGWAIPPGGKEGIVLVYVTPSGHGLKVVFKARTEWGNLIDNQHRMARLLGVEVDESCKDASRMSFIPTAEDILYINEKELFEYENQAFAEKYNDQYRGGNSQPTLFDGQSAADGGSRTDGQPGPVGDTPADGPGEADGEAAGCLTYDGGPTYQAIIDRWIGDTPPGQGKRHDTALTLAYDLRYIAENDPKLIARLLREQQFVKDIIGRGEDVEQDVASALGWDYKQTMPRRMRKAIAEAKAGIGGTESGGTPSADPFAGQLEAWGEEIGELFDDFPCLREVCGGLQTGARPAALFVSAAMLGTLMTRTWYHYYFDPEVERRLNYCILIIGHPACGKSFAARLYKQLLAPVIASDRVGNDAINRYKRDMKERGTSAKEMKKDALKAPEVIIRIHGARTSNGVFIEDMNRAVEIVGQKEMHLHMFTFDSELDSSTNAQKGGQWIDKSTMELKAFHNEEDNQQYKNNDSVTGPFDVFWNFVYTGTPLSLQKKVNERNFGTGLSTRLGAIPMPPVNFQMATSKADGRTGHDPAEQLRTWAYRLDRVAGELPIGPLVDECEEWTADHMQMARVNNDEADLQLIMRCGYYGIGVSAPFILMRHWEEWERGRSFEIDDTDRRLCLLALDIQYRSQHYLFGALTRQYFDNMDRDTAAKARHSSKLQNIYASLPEQFTLDDMEKATGNSRPAVKMICSRLAKEGSVIGDNKGTYKKIRQTI